MADILERMGSVVEARLDVNAPMQREISATSQKAHYTGLAALLQGRLGEALKLAYELDAHGRLWNVDPWTGRVLFGVPWATNSHRRWGLHRSECDLLRLYVLHLRRKHQAPFGWDSSARRWVVDLARWPSLQVVLDAPATWTVHPDLLHSAAMHLTARRSGRADAQERAPRQANGQAGRQDSASPSRGGAGPHTGERTAGGQSTKSRGGTS